MTLGSTHLKEEEINTTVSISEKIKKYGIHFTLPSLLICLSLYNEAFYLQNDHDSLAPLYLVRILVFMFGFWASLNIGNLISTYTQARRIALSESQKVFLGVFTWFILWYGFWLYAYYPGSYTADTLDAIRQISFMKINDWFSYIHPISYLFLYQFYPDMIVIGIAQLLLCAFVFADIVSFLYSQFEFKKHWKLAATILFVVFISSITSVTYYTFFYMRDIPFSVLHLYFAFYAFKLCIEYKKNPLNKQQLAKFLGLGLIVALFRGEGWIILFTAIFVLFLYGKMSFKSFSKVFIFALTSFLFLDTFLPKVINVYPTDKNHYKLTLVAYPLGFILREGKNMISSDYEEDIAQLSKVANPIRLQEDTNPYDIAAFQHETHGWREDAPLEDWNAFYKTSYKIFMENPHLFLAARTANFVSQLLLFENKTERTNDGGRFGLTYNECKSNKDNFWCQNYCDEIMFRILQMIPTCTENNGICGHVNLMKLDKIDFNWHWNSVMALMLSLLALFLYKYLPISALASAIILSRIPLVFLTAPYAFFRYIYSLYLFGIFVLPFMLLEVALIYSAMKRYLPPEQNNAVHHGII